MKILKENKNSTKELVSQFVYDKINDSFDNLAMLVKSKIPAYNPDWCADEIGIHTTRTDSAIDTLVDAVVDELFANYTEV